MNPLLVSEPQGFVLVGARRKFRRGVTNLVGVALSKQDFFNLEGFQLLDRYHWI